MNILLVNDLDSMFHGTVIERRDGLFQCPVCQKTYKRKTNAEKHFSEKLCYTYRDMFRGTETEKRMYAFFKEIAKSYYGYTSFAKFIRSKHYDTIARFFIFCYTHNLRDMMDYLNYGLSTKYRIAKNVFHIINMLTKESELSPYYRWRQKNVTFDEANHFINEHKTELINDKNFVIRSLEKGEITIDSIISHFGEEHLVEDLSPVQEERLEQFLKYHI